MNTECILCGNPLSKSQKKFCSKSCAAKVNNVKQPKRIRTKSYCCVCSKELKYNPVIGCVVCQQQVSKVEDFIPETLHTHKWNYEGYEDHLLVKGVRKNGLNKKGCPKELAAVYIIHPNGECQGGK